LGNPKLSEGDPEITTPLMVLANNVSVLGLYKSVFVSKNNEPGLPVPLAKTILKLLLVEVGVSMVLVETSPVPCKAPINVVVFKASVVAL